MVWYLPIPSLDWSRRGGFSDECVPSLAVCMCKLEAKHEVHRTKPTLVPTIHRIATTNHTSHAVSGLFFDVSIMCVVSCLSSCLLQGSAPRSWVHQRSGQRSSTYTPKPSMWWTGCPQLSSCTHTSAWLSELDWAHTLVYALMCLFCLSYCEMILHVGTFYWCQMLLLCRGSDIAVDIIMQGWLWDHQVIILWYTVNACELKIYVCTYRYNII